jgi:hypothetical protein
MTTEDTRIKGRSGSDMMLCQLTRVSVTLQHKLSLIAIDVPELDSPVL